ncbi:MAG TPA: AgmX/PglI C-terminal domain-containing protein [Candidatus Binatia bacterium]|jgi:hypothetical protein
MGTLTSHKLVSRRKRVPVGIAIAFASVGLIAAAFAVARKPEIAQPNSVSEEKQDSKPSTPWNLALGNVVVLAPELGLNASAPDEEKIELARVAAKIEGQLINLRQLYREQSESDPTLLGALTLQLTLGNAGQITEVAFLSTQMKDEKFRNAVAAEVTKWNFGEIAPEGTVIDCPLLFVREGMDIATVLNWERSLRSPRDEYAPAKSTPRARAAQQK